MIAVGDQHKRAAVRSPVLIALTATQRDQNRKHSAVRAKVEHVFRVMKCQFGYRKVRYRGIAKNGAQVFTLLALANLYLARGKLRLA